MLWHPTTWGCSFKRQEFLRRCKIGIVSKQATPWHHDNVADSWNAIPLTSVVQSHSTHLSTGTGIPEKILHWKKETHEKTTPLLGCQNGRILQLSELQIIPKP